MSRHRDPKELRICRSIESSALFLQHKVYTMQNKPIICQRCVLKSSPLPPHNQSLLPYLSPSLSLFLCLSLCLSLSLSLSIYLSIYLSLLLFLSIYPSISVMHEIFRQGCSKCQILFQKKIAQKT